jgi:hypothetical protein
MFQAGGRIFAPALLSFLSVLSNHWLRLRGVRRT